MSLNEFFSSLVNALGPIAKSSPRIADGLRITLKRGQVDHWIELHPASNAKHILRVTEYMGWMEEGAYATDLLESFDISCTCMNPKDAVNHVANVLRDRYISKEA